MNAKFLSALQLLPLRNRAALEEGLAELLMHLSGDRPLTVKGARDRFSAVNRLAREGQAQVVRGDPGEETVLVSIKDLATMIQSAASSLTLGSVLAASGFEPTGERLVLEEGFVPETGFALPGQSYYRDRAGAAA
ncbi:hypothetical protein NRB_17510 [Novosphingobium sp. 11B]